MPSLKPQLSPSRFGLLSLKKGVHDSGTLRQLLSLFLAIYLPLAALVLAVMIVVAQLQVTRQMAIIEAQEAGQVEVAARLLSHDIESFTSDLLVLAHAPSMSSFLENGNDLNRARLAELFRNVSNEKRIYDQIRFLDSEGQERIRVNFTREGAVIVPDAYLQPKGDRYYFRDSFRLVAGDVYVSPLDLNFEHQQVQRPFKPMLRLGTPVFDQAGSKRGVVIVNVFGSKLLNDFRRAMVEESHAMLVNRDGYWLSHPDPAQEWGFMFNRELTVAASYPDAWQRLQATTEGSFYTEAGLFTFATVHPLLAQHHSSTGSPLAAGSSARPLQTQDYFWKVVSLVPTQELPIGIWHKYRNHLPLLSLTLLMLAVLIGLLATALLNRRQWQQAVFDNETRLREITATLGEGVYVLDKNGLVTFLNPEAERLLGWREEELIGRNGHDTFHYHTPDGSPITPAECPVHKTIATGKVYHALHDWLIRKDGGVLPVSIVSSPILRQGEVVGSVAAFQDITPRLEAERALREAESLFRSALENAPIGMAILSLEGRFTKVNRVLCQLLGYQQAELEALSFAEITLPEDLQADLNSMQRLLNGEIDTYQMEKRYRRKDGEMVWVQVTGSVMRDADRTPLYFLAQIEDITERKQHQEQIRQLAFYDTLTGLPNRRLFLDHIDQALTQAKRYQRSMAVMFLDLDHFKQVNDKLGHDIGDQLLQGVASRLTASVRHGDTVSRQGGDEFVVVLAEIAHPEDAAHVAQKILDALDAPFALQGHIVQVGVSIGIAIYPVDGSDDIQELMKKADIAMYAAKGLGRNQYRFFDQTTEVAEENIEA